MTEPLHSACAAETKSAISRSLLAMIGILVVALLLRIAASLNDFWLDEIWSLRMAQQLRSPLGVLTALHHDNNHPLNTLFLYLLGDQPQWWVYRVPSILSGVGTVVVAGALGRRGGTTLRLVTMALAAFSFLFVQYSSESRGYGHAVFFTFLSLFLARRYLESRTLRNALFLAFGVLLGFLSHLTFLHVYLGLLAWTAAHILRGEQGVGRRLADLAKPHGPILLGLAAYYAVDVRLLTFGGGNEHHIQDVVRRTAAYLLGLPLTGLLATVSWVAGAVLLALGLRLLARRGSDEWIYYLMAIVVSPVLLLSFKRPEVLFERYFLVCAASALPLLAEVISRGIEAGGTKRVLAAAGLAVVIGGNLLQLNTLLTEGRGSYLQAIQLIAAQTPGEQVTVASDHDFRNRMVLEYYWPYTPAGKSLVYYDQAHYPPTGPEWMLLHRLEGEVAPAEPWTDVHGNRYQLARAFPHHGLSGWSWYVYRRSR